MKNTAEPISLLDYVQCSLRPPEVAKRQKQRDVEIAVATIAPRKRRTSKKKEQVVLPPEAVAYLEATSKLEAYLAKPSFQKQNDYGLEAAALFAKKREADRAVRATHGGENPYKK